jgi:hypothetical protein
MDILHLGGQGIFGLLDDAQRLVIVVAIQSRRIQ